MSEPAPELALEVAGYGHPDVQRLVAAVQAEYVVRYGGPDDSPLDVAELAPPRGLLLVGRTGGRPVAMGGWRSTEDARVPGKRPVELKRMYVVPAARGRGYARRLLAELERSARSAGHDWMVLETGLVQPEAISLYRSAGYEDIAPFGYYSASEQSVHLGRPLTG